MMCFKKLIFFLIISIVLKNIEANNFKGYNQLSNSSNESESIFNYFAPYLSEYININFFNHTNGNIAKNIIDNSYFFDVAKNITNGIKLVQFFVFNKTKTILFPWIITTGKELLKNIKNSTQNYNESDSYLIGNIIPLNASLFNYNKIQNLSNWEETIIKPEVFVPYLRGSQNKNDTITNFVITNLTNILFNEKYQPEKSINTTIIRLNRYINPSDLNNTNKTDISKRKLQFTSLFGFDTFGNLDEWNIMNMNNIPEVGNEIYQIPYTDQDYTENDQFDPFNIFFT